MAPERKEICDCGVLEDASREPDHPIRWSEKTHEYYIAYANKGSMMIYYCPFCGGKTPASRRSSLFTHVTGQEEKRLYELLKGLKSISDVVARFGPPDEDRELGAATQHPERDGKPAWGEAFRTLTYKKLSTVADIYFEVRQSDSVRGMWVQKRIQKNDSK
ncbi:MAG TPA: hypothetical protein VGN23_13910 [Verrucomicrobiae bacterium]|jgi:hypothetical protein